MLNMRAALSLER